MEHTTQQVRSSDVIEEASRIMQEFHKEMQRLHCELKLVGFTEQECCHMTAELAFCSGVALGEILNDHRRKPIGSNQ
jgi:hypothetical protein